MSLPFGCWEGGDTLFNAVDLEEDEDEQEDELINEIEFEMEFKCTDNENNKLSCETLIIAIGTASSKFIEMYTKLPKNPIAEFKQKNAVVEENRTLKKLNSVIYKSRDLIFCLCRKPVQQEYSKKWSRELLEHVSCRTVVLLSQSNKLNMNDSNQSDHDILRCLKNNSYMEKYTTRNVLTLEKGVLIGELAAALFTYCENENIPAILYTNFMESHYVDVFTLNTFQQVLDNPPLRENLEMIDDMVLKKRLRNFDGIPVGENNVYI